ncbi:hypothetical protein F4776DRAFT_629313 [Hypoxylon sp. NC0597]|nr:hypothetical protein F4776DRAFT_629313 [Hypoxylon sp. NC0597]
MDPASGQQPRRSVRQKASSSSQTLEKAQASEAGVQKPAQNEPKQEKGRKRAGRGARAKATKALEEKVSAMEPEAACREQNELLGITSEPNGASSTIIQASPKVAKSKRGRKRKRAEEMYMDDILLSDEGETGKGSGEGGDRLRRADRWIPDIEHRVRIASKPKNVPCQMWMSYTLLDDYIYRQSLTEEQVLTHPLMDEIYTFQNGGPKPTTPPGFQWGDRKRLVHIRQN